jgi:hypothetical protein
MRDLAVELVEFVDDVVDDLGSRKEVEYVHTILREGTSADRQLAVHQRPTRHARRGGQITRRDHDRRAPARLNGPPCGDRRGHGHRGQAAVEAILYLAFVHRPSMTAWSHRGRPASGSGGGHMRRTIQVLALP